MRGTSRRILIGTAAAAAVLVATGLSSAAELKLSHSHAATMMSEIHTAAWVFKNWVNENSNTMSVKIYAANALGEERAVYEGMQLGSGASCVISSSTILTNFNKTLGVLDLPFVWKSYDHINAVLDGPVGERMNSEIGKIGLKAIGWMDSWGWRNIVTSKKQVKSAEDLAGLKIRTIQSPVYIAALNAMGANATPMAWGEVYTAMQTGVLDGFEHGAAVVAQRMYEVSKYIAKTEHLIGILVFNCSQKEWDSWSDKDQKVVMEGAKLAKDVNRALAPKREQESFEFLKAKGMVIGDIDKAPFQKNAAALQDKMAADLGATDILKMIRAAE